MFNSGPEGGKAFDLETLETLLASEEGPTLDFKREQYPFEDAEERQRSELLKDILAFANSDRYRTAYILIGVDEVKGARSTIVGVQRHLDDASLQQFVDSKVNRPAEFAYFPFPAEGKEIGIIRIPIQVRPVYLEKPFGKLQANAVYVRRGSSTDMASPSEIAEMGRMRIDLS